MTIDKQIQLNICDLGGMGDGIAQHDAMAVFVPFTAPGDKIIAKIEHSAKDHIKASLVQIIENSKDRQEAKCQHFGSCGGCSLQHIKPEVYNSFKQNILTQIINDIGTYSSVIQPMVETGQKTRRRAEFKVSVNKGNIEIGFFAAKSHEIINIAQCPVSENNIVEILPRIKACLQTLKKPGIIKSISLTSLEKGIDAVFGVTKEINNADKTKLIDFSKDNNIIRLGVHMQSQDASESLYDDGKAYINFAGVDVYLPENAFLQATEKGQNIITNLVTKHLKACDKIADLYSGCGTYSFPLIKQAKQISAYEGSEEMTLAMHNAIIKNNLEPKMIASARDLFKRPLKEYELNRFDGVVINPPRNGALPQIKNIAKSQVKKIVMVSCNPATFKRDAKGLTDSGYKITMATAIDQFYWSGHLEIVAAFERN